MVSVDQIRNPAFKFVAGIWGSWPQYSTTGVQQWKSTMSRSNARYRLHSYRTNVERPQESINLFPIRRIHRQLSRHDSIHNCKNGD
jgi:hypothetical protein